ncbi:protein of unassigned function [Methylobacterium oryzae CBMB20]|uniref:Protein of unassigned function n=1 Tax=Methylobacterium oryzae CBMB20 TaxID=693986 RepID=A0A089NSZ7_9HYPH|nr:protein of unassigned function [Methylobacterium oryzae CBMB20]
MVDGPVERATVFPIAPADPMSAHRRRGQTRRRVDVSLRTACRTQLMPGSRACRRTIPSARRIGAPRTAFRRSSGSDRSTTGRPSQRR